MNKKGGVGIVILVIVIVIGLSIGGYFMFFSKGLSVGVSCPKTPEDQMIFRMPLPGMFAGGKQIGAEKHKFVNGETISVCCAEVTSSDNRELKDCIHYNKENEQDYQVVWERENGQYVKIKESLPWQGLQCIYNFDDAGEWSGRVCEDPNEKPEQEATSKEDCEIISDTQTRDVCYYNVFVKQEKVESLEDCNKMAVKKFLKEACYAKVAELKGDKTICPEIQTESTKSVCYSDVACVTGDISICEMFETEKSPTNAATVLCYKCVAKKLDDESVCEKIKDNYVRSDCYMDIAYEKNDASLCNKIDPNIIVNKQYYQEIC